MTKTLVIERDLPHPPHKVWRALTESHLLAEWLMGNDFEAVQGRVFNFRGEPNPHWNGITDCEVLQVEPDRRLSYTWRSSGEEKGRVDTVVTYTLTPTETGTHLLFEQSGFGPAAEGFYQGASFGWQKMLTAMEGMLDRL